MKLFVIFILTAACFGQETKPVTKASGTASPDSLKAEIVASLVDGRCSICLKEHEKSTVTMNIYGSCTAMACGSGYYDEDGKYHAPPPCNTCSTMGKCSRGHLVVQEWKK